MNWEVHPFFLFGLDCFVSKICQPENKDSKNCHYWRFHIIYPGNIRISTQSVGADKSLESLPKIKTTSPNR